MSIFKSIGKAVGGLVNNTVGRLPIVGGAAKHIGNAFSGKEPFLRGLVGGGLPILAGLGTFGLGPAAGIFGKIGGAIGGKVGSQIGTSALGGTLLKGAGSAVGHMSPMQLAGLGTAIANVAGQGAQRRSAQHYSDAQTALRNQLMSRILSGQQQTYDFTPEQ